MEDHLMGLVFCSFLLTLLFSTCRAGEVKVVGQSEPVVAVAGDDVILPCTVRDSNNSTVNAVDEGVKWQRPDLKLEEVHFYRNRADDNKGTQNEIYSGRTSLFKDEMKNGNISLKLTNVRFTDAGNYTCFVRDKRPGSVQLIVVSRPEVCTIVGVMGVVLHCEVKFYIYNLDGSILPAGPTETQTDSDVRYTVREVTVQKTRNNMFTCRVTQQQINLTMETQIHVQVPEPCSDPSLSWLMIWLFGGLTLGLIVFIAVAGVNFILCRTGLLHWGKEVYTERLA